MDNKIKLQKLENIYNEIKIINNKIKDLKQQFSEITNSNISDYMSLFEFAEDVYVSIIEQRKVINE